MRHDPEKMALVLQENAEQLLKLMDGLAKTVKLLEAYEGLLEEDVAAAEFCSSAQTAVEASRINLSLAASMLVYVCDCLGDYDQEQEANDEQAAAATLVN